MVHRSVAITIIILTLVISLAMPVLAATTSNLALLGRDEDRFYNYDFDSQDLPVSGNNVDWAVDMLFYHNAEVDKVKDIYWGAATFAVSKHFRLDDDAGMVWDSDKGTKSIGIRMAHMRVYADADDRMHNESWGYYVLGTSHYDKWEGTLWAQHGWSEDAEAELVQIARDKGYTVFEDWSNFFNAEPDRWEDNHFWQNDGYASAVYVP